MTTYLEQRAERGFRFSLLAGALLVSLLTSSGCTRRFFQRWADSEVDSVLHQKDKYAQWRLDGYYVWPHPLSRFADPTDWNRPPMPPDDPAAWDLSPHPQRPILRGHHYWQGTGYLELMRKWDADNRARIEAERREPPAAADGGKEPLLPGETKTFDERAAEVTFQIERELNPPTTTTAALPEEAGGARADECRPFLLNLGQITELGFLNSREFQTQREALYLSALAVTAERFAFIAQPFATEVLVRERAGQQAVTGPSNRWTSLGTTGFTKYFSTGALLLLNFANLTVYNLGRTPLHTTSVSTLNFDIIQPFLAGGGRAVALEPLTQTERNLLYAIRDFFRFRQEFFVFFAAGQTVFVPGVGAGVQALSPATQPTPGAFVPGPFTLPLVSNPATVQVAPQPFLGPALGAGILVTPQGYLSTVGERGVLVNSYKNIQALQRFLRLFEKYLEGGIVNQVQKGQVEQSLLQSIETTLGTHQTYRISLDQLKQQLGLPMTVPIELDPAPLKPMINLVERYEKLSIDTERVAYNALDYGRTTEVKQLRQRLHRLIETTPLLRGTQTQERIRSRWNYWENLDRDKTGDDRITALVDRLKQLENARAAFRSERAKRPGEALSAEDLRRSLELYFERDVASLEFYLSVYEKEAWKTIREPVERQARANEDFRRVYRSLIGMVDVAVSERQQDIKEAWPALPAICAEGVDLLSAPEAEALLAAERTVFNSRVDLMNVRAQLVDAWRKIRVAANALMGTFNVDYHLDATSPATVARPFALGGSRTRHQLIFTGQLPLVRILQRNNYRSTLINFQQLRRNLMSFEDQLLFNIRFDLRTLRTGAYNYQRVQKRAIELAYMQVDQSLQQFSQPQAPPGGDIQGLVGPVGARPQPGDPAALTNQLLTTQGSLLRAQNDLYNTWIGFLTTRMAFYRDLGVMQLDNRGVWIDDNSTCPCDNAADNNQPGAGQRPGERGTEQLPPPRPQPERLPQPNPEPAANGPKVETNN